MVWKNFDLEAGAVSAAATLRHARRRAESIARYYTRERHPNSGQVLRSQIRHKTKKRRPPREMLSTTGALFIQLSRRTIGQLMEKPALPNGAPPGPVSSPSRTNVRMLNSSRS
jgi:hypothetical protein